MDDVCACPRFAIIQGKEVSTYYIKVVTPEHLDPCFAGIHYPRSMRDTKPKWMNYQTQADAERLELGAKVLIYVTAPVKKILWAVEYGEIASSASAYPYAFEQAYGKPSHGDWPFLRPITFIAWMSPCKDTDYERYANSLAIKRIPTLNALGYDKPIR